MESVATEEEPLEGVLFRKDSGDKYKVLDLIGRGQHSSVHLAQNLMIGSNADSEPSFVVLKRIDLLSMMDAKLRRDCVREVDHLRSLSHTTIIRYLDCYIQKDEMELVIVLEWCKGGDLGRLLREWRELSVGVIDEAIVWHYFVQVCDAVRHMHGKRLMHRDIKPSNIFLTDIINSSSASLHTTSGHQLHRSNIKVGDLGLSRYFSSKTCQALSAVGTPYYMSPELIRGQPYDWSSDVWSLGCLLYELRTLRNPFFLPDLNFYTLGKRICSAKFDPLPENSSEEMKTLVSAMLAPDPTQRPTIDQIHELSLIAFSRFSQG